MPGAISQLVSYGAQDVYLTGNPQITFFKSVYRRYTNFAMESIQQTFDGTTDFGSFPTVTISRNGDLCGPMWIEVTLPNLLGYDINPAPPVIPGSATLVQTTNILTLTANTALPVPPPGAPVGNLFIDTSGNYWQTRRNDGPVGAFTYGNIIAYNGNNGNFYNSIPFTESSNIYTWPYMNITANTSPGNAPLLANVTIPTSNLRYVNGIGLALFNSIEMQLGGQRIDKHYSNWWDIWSELTETSEKLAGYNKMVGRYDQTYYKNNWDRTMAAGGTYYVPMKFCYNRNPGLYMPLVALPYHELKLNFDINSYMNSVRCNYPITSLTSKSGALPLAITNMKLYCDYIFLDAPERIRMSEIQHEYLVTQLQWQGSEPISGTGGNGDGATNRKFKLNFNHPVRELVFVYQASSTYAQNPITGNDIFNYEIPQPGAGGTEIFKQVSLLINGSERFSARPGAYFRLVQPYDHHVRVPSKSVYVYSFALEDADSKQPNGSANFTRYDSAQLQVILNDNLPSGRVQIYAPNFNVLRIAAGMGGLAYSN